MKPSISATFPLLRDTMRHRYPQLTDDDFAFEPGDEEKLLRHLQERTGESRETMTILLRSTGVNLPAPWPEQRSSAATPPGDANVTTPADLDHSRGSGIPDDTSRSGGRSI